MTYRIEFTIFGLPKTTNSGGRSHWSVKVKEASSWKRAVMAAVGSRRPDLPLTKAKLLLIRMSSSEPDYDGLVSSFKHVIDGLIQCGVLADDKLSNISVPDYQWVKAKRGKGSIFVSVEEV